MTARPRLWSVPCHFALLCLLMAGSGGVSSPGGRPPAELLRTTRGFIVQQSSGSEPILSFSLSGSLQQQVKSPAHSILFSHLVGCSSGAALLECPCLASFIGKKSKSKGIYYFLRGLEDKTSQPIGQHRERSFPISSVG